MVLRRRDLYLRRYGPAYRRLHPQHGEGGLYRGAGPGLYEADPARAGLLEALRRAQRRRPVRGVQKAAH